MHYLAAMAPDPLLGKKEGVVPSRIYRKLAKSWEIHHENEQVLENHAAAKQCLGVVTG